MRDESDSLIYKVRNAIKLSHGLVTFIFLLKKILKSDVYIILFLL